MTSGPADTVPVAVPSTDPDATPPPSSSSAPPSESYDWDAARERLREAAKAEHPPAWIPEQDGDELVGVVVEVKPAVPAAFGAVPVVTIDGPAGVHSVWLHHAVLRRQFERSGVQLGELVLIRYEGRRHPEGGGNAYADYSLVVDRPTPSGSPDWRAIANAHGDPLDEPGSSSSSGPPAFAGADPHADFPSSPTGDSEADDIPF